MNKLVIIGNGFDLELGEKKRIPKTPQGEFLLVAINKITNNSFVRYNS